jgi:CRP-like cAMP-binding protein
MAGTTFDIEVIAAADLDVIALGDGAEVFARGDLGDHAYIVRSGIVEIHCVGKVIETISPGEIFGGVTLLDNQPRLCTAVARGDVEIMPIDRPMFETLVRDDPDFALTVMQLVVRRLRATLTRLDDVFVEAPPAAAAEQAPARAAV